MTIEDSYDAYDEDRDEEEKDEEKDEDEDEDEEVDDDDYPRCSCSDPCCPCDGIKVGVP